MSAPLRTRDRRRATLPALFGAVIGSLLTGLVLPFVVGGRHTDVVSAGSPLAAAAGDAGAGQGPGAGGGNGATAGGSSGAGDHSARTVSAGGAGASAAAGPSAAGGGAVPAGGATTGGGGPAGTAANTTPVKVGFTIFQVSGAGSIGFLINVDPAFERAAYQTFVDYLNATGGINGRPIQPYYSTYDLLNQDSQNASCLSLTQDDKVFAVVGGYNFTSADECVVDQNKTVMFNNNSFTADELYATGRHVSIFARASRMMSVFAKRMTQSGQISGKKVGILDDVGADPTRSVLNSLAAGVRAGGGTVARESVLSGDLGTGSSQIPVEVNQMRSAGVQTVLLIAFGVYATQFVQQADSEAWKPVYGATDWQAMYSDVAGQNMPASFDGAYSITTTRTGEWRVGDPPPPQAAVCQHIYEQVSHNAMPQRGSDDYGVILGDCDTMLMFAAAARAAGSNLTDASFLAATQGIGSLPEAQWGGGSFGPGKLDFNDEVRINRYSSQCKCWKPSTPFSSS